MEMTLPNSLAGSVSHTPSQSLGDVLRQVRMGIEMTPHEGPPQQIYSFRDGEEEGEEESEEEDAYNDHHSISKAKGAVGSPEQDLGPPGKPLQRLFSKKENLIIDIEEINKAQEDKAKKASEAK